MDILAYRTYRCSDHPHMEDIARCFCEEFGVQPRVLVLACAGYMHAGSVINKNLPWPVMPRMMKEALELDNVTLLNDLEALAYAVGHIDSHGATTLKAPMTSVREAGPIVILGPGTGAWCCRMVSRATAACNDDRGWSDPTGCASRYRTAGAGAIGAG